MEKQPLYTAPFIYDLPKEPLLSQKRPQSPLTRRVLGAIVFILLIASFTYTITGWETAVGSNCNIDFFSQTKGELYEVSPNEFWYVPPDSGPVYDDNLKNVVGPNGRDWIMWAQRPTGWFENSQLIQGTNIRRGKLCNGNGPLLQSRQQFCQKPYLRLKSPTGIPINKPGPPDYECPECFCTFGEAQTGTACNQRGRHENCKSCINGYVKNQLNVCTKDEVRADTIGWDNCLKVADQISSSKPGGKMCGACRSLPVCEFVASQTYTVTSKTNGVRMYISNVESKFVLAVDQYADNVKVSAVNVQARVHDNGVSIDTEDAIAGSNQEVHEETHSDSEEAVAGRYEGVDHQICSNKKNYWIPRDWNNGPDNNCAEWWNNDRWINRWGAYGDCSQCNEDFGKYKCSKTCCDNCNAWTNYPDADNCHQAGYWKNGYNYRGFKDWCESRGSSGECCYNSVADDCNKCASQPGGADASSYYRMEDQSVLTCPIGKEITSAAECQTAFDAIKKSYNLNPKRALQENAWNGVPKACSVQVGLDDTPHFNTISHTDNKRIGEFRIICKKTHDVPNTGNDDDGGVTVPGGEDKNSRWFCIPGQESNGNNCNKANGGLQMWYLVGQPGKSGDCGKDILNGARDILCLGDEVRIRVAAAISNDEKWLSVAGSGQVPTVSTAGTASVWVIESVNQRHGPVVTGRPFFIKHKTLNCYIATRCKLSPTGKPDANCLQQTKYYQKQPIVSCDPKPASGDVSRFAFNFEVRPYNMDEDEVFGRFTRWESYDMRPVSPLAPYIADLWDTHIKDNPSAIWANVEFGKFLAYPIGNVSQFVNRQINANMMTSVDPHLRDTMNANWQADYWWSNSQMTDDDRKHYDTLLQYSIASSMKQSAEKNGDGDPFPSCSKENIEAKSSEQWDSDWGKGELNRVREELLFSTFPSWKQYQADAANLLQKLAVYTNSPEFALWLGSEVPSDKIDSVILHLATLASSLSNNVEVATMNWDPQYAKLFEGNLPGASSSSDASSASDVKSAGLVAKSAAPPQSLVPPAQSLGGEEHVSALVEAKHADLGSFIHSEHWDRVEVAVGIEEEEHRRSLEAKEATLHWPERNIGSEHQTELSDSGGSGTDPNFADDTVCQCLPRDLPEKAEDCKVHTDASSCTLDLQCAWGPDTSQKCLAQIPACETFIGKANALPGDCMRERVIKGLTTAQMTALAGMNPELVLQSFTQQELEDMFKKLATAPETAFTGVTPTDYSGKDSSAETMGNVHNALAIISATPGGPTAWAELKMWKLEQLQVYSIGDVPIMAVKPESVAEVGQEAIQRSESFKATELSLEKLGTVLKIIDAVIALGIAINIFTHWDKSDWSQRAAAVKSTVQTVQFMCWSMSELVPKMINWVGARGATVLDAFADIAVSTADAVRTVTRAVGETMFNVANNFVRNLLAIPEIGADAVRYLRSSELVIDGLRSTAQSARLAASYARMSEQFAARFASSSVVVTAKSLGEVLGKAIPYFGIIADGASAFYNVKNAMAAWKEGDKVKATLEWIQFAGNVASVLIGAATILAPFAAAAGTTIVINPVFGLIALGIVVTALLIESFVLPALRDTPQKIIQRTLQSNGACSRRLLMLPQPKLHLPHPGQLAIPLPAPHPIIERIDEQDL